MNSVSMIIREARETDAADICRLNLHALGYDYGVEKTAQRLRLILANNANRVAVAVMGGQTVGYIHGAAYDCAYTDALKNILALAVDVDHRHCGIGRALLAHIEQWAVDDGCAGVCLVSGIDREGAHRFYEACGYRMRKQQKNFVKLFG